MTTINATNEQLELGFNGIKPRANAARREGRIARANWWFAKMREAVAGAMDWQAGNDYTWLPVWFKIHRVGDVFTGYQSVDGMNWFKVGSSTVTMTNQCLAGLVVTGGKKDSFNTTVFDHVRVKQ